MEEGLKYVKSVETKHIHNTVMVCGATGFIGSHVVAELLKKGYTDIHIISRTIDSCKNLKNVLNFYGLEEKFDTLNIHYGAITNFSWLVQAMHGCHTIFNCAATVNMNTANGSKLIRDNVTLAYLIGEAAIKVNAEKIIHVSSISALFAEKYPVMTTEDSYIQTIKGESPYAVSKFYSENEMWRIAEKGIKVTIVNPAVVLGIGDWNNSMSPMIFKKLQHGIKFYTSGIMGYVMVEDVARAMVALSVCDKAAGERFILCGENLTYKELMGYIAKSLGQKAPVIKVSDWIIQLSAHISKAIRTIGLKPKYSESMLRNLISKHCYNGSKISNYIDFKYSDFEEAINNSGKYYKKIK